MSVFGKFKKLKAAYKDLGQNRWERFWSGVRKFGLKESVRRAVSTLRVSALSIPDEQLTLSNESGAQDCPPQEYEVRSQITFTATQDMDNLVRMEVLTANSAPMTQSSLTLHVFDGDALLGSAISSPVQAEEYTTLTFPAIGGIAGKPLRFELTAEGEGAGILINPVQEQPGYEFEPGKSPICRIYAENKPDDYAAWIECNKPTEAQLRKQRKGDATPKMAVVSFGDGQGPLAESLKEQTHTGWELIANAERNGGTGELLRFALDSTDSPYIVLARSSDTLEPHALHEIAANLRGKSGCVLLYVDDDRVDAAGRRSDPFFKPDYSPYYLLSFNYMGHFIVLSRELAEKVAASGATTVYDAVLKAAKNADEVVHVRTVLVHITESETRGVESGDEAEADVKALEGALADRGVPGTAQAGFAPGFWSVDYAMPDPAPLVSIIIPSHDEVDVLRACMESILVKTTYPNLEVLIAENHSKDSETFGYYEELRKDPRVHILTWTDPFNFASINNWAAKQATGELLLLLNNDTTVITPDWLERMVPLAMQPDVGAVGAKLLYPDDTIQHGGVFIAMHGIADHAHKGAPASETGSFGRLSVPYDVSAVTGACIMTRKAVFDEVGGLDEGFVLAFNDVDLCYRIGKAGYSVLFEPRAQLYHYESKTRGYEVTPEQQARFQNEQFHWMSKWSETCNEDPFYNPNLRYDTSDFSVAPEPTGKNAARVVRPYYALLEERLAKKNKENKQ